jgi:dTDP-4-dehydrorhamnose reductase
MLRLGAERDEVTVVDDQVGCPTYTGDLAVALVGLAARRAQGVLHVAGGGSCSWWELACATFERAGLSVTVHRGLDRRSRPARAAPRLLRPRLHPLRRAGPAGVAGRSRRPFPRSGDSSMKLLVCGGAGFIGSNFVRIRVRDHGDEVVVLDKLTYAGRRENLQDLPEARLVVGGIEDPEAVAEAIEGADAVVNFAAETHVDRSISEPGGVHQHARDGHLRAARGRPRTVAALRAGLHR